MKLGILSNTRGEYGQMFLDAAKKRDHEAVLLPFPELSALLSQEEVSAYAKELDLFDLDVVLVRGMNRSPCLRVLIELLEKKGVSIIDSRFTKTYDNNCKFYTYMKLAEQKILFPKTVYIGDPKGIKLDTIAQKLNVTPPIIAKITSSSQGRGVFLIDSQEKLDEIISQISKRERHQLVFQEFLPHEGDIRVLVIGGKVLGAMYRKKKESEFRSNIAVGAIGMKFEMTEKVNDLAIKAASANDMEIAGVDILISNGKHYIIEINRAPQFKGFMKATGIDVSTEIIKYCESVIK